VLYAQSSQDSLTTTNLVRFEINLNTARPSCIVLQAIGRGFDF
jgi:hypothetical protein